MFILTGSIAAFIISAIQILLFFEKRSAGKCIHCIIKNLFAVNLISLAILKYVLKFEHFLVTEKYKADSFIMFFFLALGIGAALLLLFAVFNGHIAFEKETPKKVLAQDL